MRSKQTGYTFERVSIGCFLIMSISFLLMPFASLGILPGLLFWIGLMLGAVLQIALEIQRRRFFAAYHIDRRKMQKPRCGLLIFGSNKYAKITDILLLISFVLSVIIYMISKGLGYFCNICIALTVFLFCLHCIFNGRNYFHVMNRDRVKKAVEANLRLNANGTRAGNNTERRRSK